MTNPATCNCPDDRCAGFHHAIDEPCWCAKYYEELTFLEHGFQPITCPSWCTFDHSREVEWLEVGDSICHSADVAYLLLSNGRRITVSLDSVDDQPPAISIYGASLEDLSVDDVANLGQLVNRVQAQLDAILAEC